MTHPTRYRPFTVRVSLRLVTAPLLGPGAHEWVGLVTDSEGRQIARLYMDEDWPLMEAMFQRMKPARDGHFLAQWGRKSRLDIDPAQKRQGFSDPADIPAWVPMAGVDDMEEAS